MEVKNSHNLLSWVLLVLIGTSVTFSTLHSHHNIEWNHTDSHVNTGTCLSSNTNFCPVCGYLFNANFVDRKPPVTSPSFAVVLPSYSDSKTVDSYSGSHSGRSPPFVL